MATAGQPGNPDQLTLPVPDGVTLGISQITVLLPNTVYNPDPGASSGSDKVVQYIGSNPAQFNPAGNYTFVALPEGNSGAGALAVIDNDSTDVNSPSSDFGNVLTEIPLGTSEQPTSPRDVAITPDDSRAYVTLEGSGQVAVVDTLTLQEVNVHPGNSAAATASTQSILGPVTLDPSLNLTQITGPTDIRGTVTNVPGFDHWSLQLGQWTSTFTPVDGIPSLPNGLIPLADGITVPRRKRAKSWPTSIHGTWHSEWFLRVAVDRL